MKNNQLIAMLVGILFITTGITGFLLLRYNLAHRKLQEIEARLNNTKAFVQALSADAIEYSKKNPAIDPLLKSFNLTPAAPVASAPGGRPATR
jgi:hypothetical protein